MKRLFSIVMVIVISFGILSGCGQSKAGADDSTIVIWHDKEDAVVEVLQERLAKLEPDVHVVLEKKSDLTESLKMVGNDPKSAPDMYDILNVTSETRIYCGFRENMIQKLIG